MEKVVLLKNKSIKICNLFIFILLAIASKNISAQEVIKVHPEFKKNVSYNFSNEWHYLSSELYLFNQDKFDNLINELYPIVKKNTKKNEPDNSVQSILVTAKINNTTMGNELVYPIYNFKVDKNAEKYKTQTTTNAELIRIIDNLPMSSVNKYVDARINLEIITEQKSNKIYEIIADQLNIVSQLSNPTGAALTLVGELGKVLKNKAKGNSYQFESTVRIYEEEDFNKRLHSVNIYVFMPIAAEQAFIDTTALGIYLDTTDNPVINRGKLTQLLKYFKYPYMVIANYKSKYISAPVIGDEIDFDAIEKRRTKVKSAYESKLLTTEIYTQEIKLIEFLEKFAQLKIDINNYELNYKNRITDDFTRMYLKILKEYRSLKNLYKLRNTEFKNDEVYNNEFKKIYESILVNSEIYLEKDNNLRNIKECVNLIYNINNKLVSTKFEPTQSENRLRILYSVNLPTDETKTDEIIEINSLIKQLEEELYKNTFKSEIDKLNTAEISENALPIIETIKNQIKPTNCKLCRDNANVAITTFNEKFEAVKKAKALEQAAQLIRITNDEIYYKLIQEACLQKHFSDDYPNGLPAHIQIIYQEFTEMKQTREKLQLLTNQPIKNLDLIKVNEYIDELKFLTDLLQSTYNSICKKAPSLCECN